MAFLRNSFGLTMERINKPRGISCLLIMTKNWLIFTFFALLMWGFWGFFPKLATKHINPKSALVYEVLGTLIIGIVIFSVSKFTIESNLKGILFAILTGIAATLGTFFFFYAISKGTTAVVVTITALYPLITIFLSYLFLNESITLTQGVGIFLAVIAMILFTL